MHRAIQKKQEPTQSQGSDDKTADEVTVGDRCAIPREIYNEISTIASASNINIIT